MSHRGLAIYIKKCVLRQKEELWKLKYFTMQKYNLSKTPLKRNQNHSRYYNSIITNLKSQHKPKTSSLKNPYKNRPISINYLGAKIPLKLLLHSIMNLNILDLGGQGQQQIVSKSENQTFFGSIVKRRSYPSIEINIVSSKWPFLVAFSQNVNETLIFVGSFFGTHIQRSNALSMQVQMSSV